MHAQSSQTIARHMDPFNAIIEPSGTLVMFHACFAREMSSACGVVTDRG